VVFWFDEVEKAAIITLATSEEPSLGKPLVFS